LEKTFLRIMQGVLFPALERQLGPLSDKHRQLVGVLNLIQLETMTVHPQYATYGAVCSLFKRNDE
jgi:hypothetical protein